MKYWILIFLCSASLYTYAQQYVRGDYCGNVKTLAQKRGIKFTKEMYDALELALITDLQDKNTFLLAPSVTIGILYNVTKDNPINELSEAMKEDIKNLALATWGKPDRYYTFIKQYYSLSAANQYVTKKKKKEIEEKTATQLYKSYDNVVRNGTSDNIVSVHDTYLIIQSNDGYKFKVTKEDWNNPAYRKAEDMRK